MRGLLLLTLAASISGFAHAASFVPGSGNDPRLRAADFLLGEERYLGAIAELLRLQAQSPGQTLPDDYYRRLDLAMAGFGVAAANGGTVAQTVSYQSSDDVSAAAIARYNAGVGALKEGRAEGVAILDAIGVGPVANSAAAGLRDKANLALGYYFLRSRQGESAIAVLSRVRSPGPFANRALLGLGWAFLIPRGSNEGKVQAAAEEPAAADAPAVARSADEIAEQRRRAPFRYNRSVAHGEREEDLRRALVPWTELIGRDPLDPAVQEGLLAIPYSLDHLGAHEQAQRYYLRAIDLLERTSGQIDQALQHVGSGRMADILLARGEDASNGWPAWVAVLPEARWWLTVGEAPENFYLERLSASDSFQEALMSCGDLHALDAALATHVQRLASLDDPRALQLRARIDELRLRLAAASGQQRKRLEDIASAVLQQQKQQTDQYLVEARFALARIHDRAPNPYDKSGKPYDREAGGEPQ
jgi:hypothetical protein